MRVPHFPMKFLWRPDQIWSNMIERIRLDVFSGPAILFTSFIPRLVALTKRIVSYEKRLSHDRLNSCILIEGNLKWILTSVVCLCCDMRELSIYLPTSGENLPHLLLRFYGCISLELDFIRFLGFSSSKKKKLSVLVNNNFSRRLNPSTPKSD